MKTYMIAVLFGVSLALAGCSSGNDSSMSEVDQLFVVHNVVVNGQTIPCVVYDDANRGSELTCNWAGYKN